MIIAAGYRIGPFEVESACLEHPAVREAAAVASPDEVKGHVVKAFIVLTRATSRPTRWPRRSRRFVRGHLWPTPTRAGSSSPTTCRRP